MSEGALTRFDREKHCLPDGGSWHWRQQPVLTAFQSLGGFLVAWDNGKGGKIYGHYSGADTFYNSLLSNPNDKRWGYELIPENTLCKGYLDVEWEGPADQGHTKLQMIIHVLRVKIREASCINPELHVACGTRSIRQGHIKHSYHIVVENLIFECNHDGQMRNYFTLGDT
jgi:hypothetical protein